MVRLLPLAFRTRACKRGLRKPGYSGDAISDEELRLRVNTTLHTARIHDFQLQCPPCAHRGAV
jgi:hypothetical protein